MEAFEPRLSQVTVTVEASAGDHLRLVCRITGMLIVDRVAEPVSFPTVFQSDTGRVEVHLGP